MKSDFQTKSQGGATLLTACLAPDDGSPNAENSTCGESCYRNPLQVGIRSLHTNAIRGQQKDQSVLYQIAPKFTAISLPGTDTHGQAH